MVDELNSKEVFESIRKKLKILISQNSEFPITFNNEIGKIETLFHKALIQKDINDFLIEKLSKLEDNQANVELANEVLGIIDVYLENQ